MQARSKIFRRLLVDITNQSLRSTWLPGACQDNMLSFSWTRITLLSSLKTLETI